MTDRVMLYALMSWASFRCSRSDSADRRATFKAIVYRELGLLNTERCLQSAHALLFLAFAEYGDHQFQAGSDAFAMCVDIMRFLKLHVEQIHGEDVRVYGFPADVNTECRRRTYWAAFCFDSHLQLKGLSLEVMNRSGIAIKSPCAIEPCHCEWLLPQSCFELDSGLENPSTTQAGNTICSTAHMIWITRIFAGIVSNVSRVAAVHRSLNRPPDDQYVRGHLHVRLEAWADAYGNCMLDQSATRSGSMGGLGILYYNSQMELSRRIWHRGLSDSELASHARNATKHALAVLILAEQVTSRGGSEMRDYLFVSRGFSTVHAIFGAVDIITATGKVADVLELGSRIMSLMYSALDLLAHLGLWWGHDFVKYKQVEERVQTVFRSAEAALKVRKTFFYCSHPIGDAARKDFDLIYGTDRKHYVRLAYFEGDLIEDKDIFEIDTR